MIKFQWKDTYGFLKLPANVFGQEFLKLEKRKKTTPQDVVDIARPKKAPLHDAFEWDDSVAGEAWRRDQAGSMIRALVVVHVEKGETRKIRAIVSISNNITGRQYMSIGKVLKSEDLTKAMIADAFESLGHWRNKYSHLKEFAEIVQAIDNFSLDTALSKIQVG